MDQGSTNYFAVYPSFIKKIDKIKTAKKKREESKGDKMSDSIKIPKKKKRKRNQISIPGSPPKTDKKKIPSFEKYVNESMCRVFGISLKKKQDYIYLESFAEDNKSTYFKYNMVEAALVERFSIGFEGSLSPLTYLCKCYGRIQPLITKENKRKEKKQKRLILLNEYKDLIVSYFQIILLNDDLFPETHENILDENELDDIDMDNDNRNENRLRGPVKLLPFLLDSSDDYSLPVGFLSHFIKRFKDTLIQDYENEKKSVSVLHRIFDPIFFELHRRMKKFNILGKYLPYLETMAVLTKELELCKCLVNHRKWLPGNLKKNGYSMEFDTILGPFFILTTYYDVPVVGDTLFFKGLSVSQLDDIKRTTRNQISIIQQTLHIIVLNLLRKIETRRAILDWLWYVIEGNKTRAMIRANYKESSSEGFLTNFCAVLLKLSTPFIKNEKKLKSINPKFGLSNHIVDWSADTNLGLNTTETKEAVKELKNMKFNFPTECFYLTYRSLNIGVLKTCKRYKTVVTSFNDASRKYNRAKLSGHLLSKAREDYENCCVIKWSAETQLFHPELIKATIDFYNFSVQWFNNIVDPTGGNRVPKIPPQGFISQSEFFIENISQYVIFLCRYAPQVVNILELREIFNFMSTYLSKKSYIKNPYIRAKFPGVFASLTPYEQVGVNRDVMDIILIRNEITEKKLIPGLMILYVDIENTGSSNQFYDKFTPRYFIALFLKYLWEYDAYRNAFVKEITKKGNLRFFNMLLNDAIYLLDESLKILAKIKQHQLNIQNPEWKKKNYHNLREIERGIAGEERHVTSYMLLANETVRMLNYLSKDAPKPFLRPEMINRVAPMLNYFLVELAGPKCQNLKVQNPKKYHFDPKYLLTEITDTYSHLFESQEFIEAVARDERSFKPKVFRDTAIILKRLNRRGSNYIDQFKKFIKNAELEKKKLEEEDEDLGEIPDEFMDPITYEIMKNPVLLPSGMSIDRSTIERHLLNSQTDPFSRTPLTISMLKPNQPLREKIEKFKKSKIK